MPLAACWKLTGDSKVPTRCGGRPPTERRTSIWIADVRTTTRKAAATVSARTLRVTRRLALVLGLCLDRFQDVARAWQYLFLEDWSIGHGTIERGHALDWRIQVLEELIGDPCGDLGAEAARELILVRD